jgi:hypothetical protein
MQDIVRAKRVQRVPKCNAGAGAITFSTDRMHSSTPRVRALFGRGHAFDGDTASTCGTLIFVIGKYDRG